MKSHRIYANFQSAQVPQQVARPLTVCEYIYPQSESLKRSVPSKFNRTSQTWFDYGEDVSQSFAPFTGTTVNVSVLSATHIWQLTSDDLQVCLMLVSNREYVTSSCRKTKRKRHFAPIPLWLMTSYTQFRVYRVTEVWNLFFNVLRKGNVDIKSFCWAVFIRLSRKLHNKKRNNLSRYKINATLRI